MADEKNNHLHGNEMNKADLNTAPSPAGERVYEIHIKGQLNSHWSEWLEGLEVQLAENGEMILFGPMVDQAALMGVLLKLNRLNLTLLSINEVKRKE
jgi:hypothetical protein